MEPPSASFEPEPGEDNRPSPIEEGLRDPLFVLTVIIAGLVVLTWLLVSVLAITRAAQIKQTEVSLRDIDRQLAQPPIKATLATYRTLKGVAEDIDDVRAKRFLFLPTWEVVKASVPQDVQLTSLSLGKDNIFRLSGLTPSVSSVALMTKKLSGQGRVSQVSPLSIDQQGPGTFAFTIIFQAREGEADKPESEP